METKSSPINTRLRLGHLGKGQLISSHLEISTDVLTPIQRIPAELLGEIFLRCLPKKRHPTVRLAPLLLCQVCSHWRGVALSLNQLWDEFCLLYDYSDGGSKSVTLAAKNWFERAGEHSPLSFTICYAEKPLYDRLLGEILIPLVHRFCHVDLAWNNGIDLMPFFNLRPGMLKSAALQFLGSPDVTSITHIDVTSLRKVSISSVTSSSIIPELCDSVLVWGRLTHLIITESTDAQILVELLGRCHSLQKITCVVTGVESRVLFQQLFPTLNQPITLPYLHDFDLTLYRENNHSFLPLFRLKLPILRRFCLRESPSGTDEMLWGEGTHFISQLNSIKDLSLSGYALTSYQLLDTLRLTPNLMTLDLDVRINHAELFRAMTRTSTPVDFVPLLKDITIHLNFSDIPTFSSTAFVDMVRSRQIMTGPNAEPISYIRGISILVPPEGQNILDDIKNLLGKGSSARMPAGRFLRKKIMINPIPATEIDLNSW
ncbi:hypothetical protein BDZ94DRAFT_1260440 [Collybia nuda]|uniref:F-box domain-containing protein n=1 Tax=Collybia nuda TaxID=64659 RepID=A0A9P5Y533_9AGAR|nr:hypothetical protein BDZ94DRAFT_1260440 [Collybia nuda]